jgi:hypothetical protein
MARLLGSRARVDDREVETIRRRWPALTGSLAKQLAPGLPQISRLEAIALNLVRTLEADLRSSLSWPPVRHPPPVALIELIIGDMAYD